MGSSVIVVQYDPEWARLYEKLRDFVLTVLTNLITTIEHVGSTSVPGLAAKPIVDMDVVVPWHHLYLCTEENAEYKRHIIFRNYLRDHPDDSKGKVT